jgi:hypothetical protein
MFTEIIEKGSLMAIALNLGEEPVYYCPHCGRTTKNGEKHEHDSDHVVVKYTVEDQQSNSSRVNLS